MYTVAKEIQVYDTFSLVSSDFIRTANVVALTDVSLLVVDKEWVGPILLSGCGLF